MRKVLITLAVVTVGLTAPAQAGASYSGSLSSSDGSLVVHGNGWVSPIASSSVSWTVSELGAGQWHYQYTVTTPGPSIDKIIVETSPTFTSANMSGTTSNPTGWAGTVTVGTYMTTANGGMPSNVYGIQFCATVDPTVVVVGFDSNRAPVWGDFYASGYSVATVPPSDSFFHYLYNAGFAAADPSGAAQNGSLLNHVLVPDSVSTNVPAPGAVILCGLGAFVVDRLRRRRML